jgi:hypothetical protein
MGGQVAHISAAEAEMLRRMGGAGTINPVTGLPEYYSPGTTGYSTSTSTGYGGPGPAANAAGSRGAAQRALFNWNLSPDGPQSVTGDMMAHLQTTAKNTGGWGDAFMNATFGKLAEGVAKWSIPLNAIEGLNYLFGGQPTSNPVTALGQYLYSGGPYSGLSSTPVTSVSSGIASLVGNGSGESAAISTSPTTGWYTGPGSALAPGSPGQIINPQPGELLLG